ncbi:Chromosome partition protein Smc [Planctomycetes bacterium Pan216]|uniref:Chromosome partition protein Smc n=1 Tax=Kolteria novifilia TaxID=2527975 RepID=A0A518B3A8_9BACT|nr:Chromosome partition protein Smc [Planctomycetes bacterium Pan216]
MGKRRKDDSEAVSLFPFLSILACVIGTLTLMITGLALSQIETEQSPEVVERSEEFNELKKKLEADREELERLKQLLANAAKLREELLAAKEELARLESQKDRKSKDNKQLESSMSKLLAELNRLRKRVKEIETEPGELDKQIAKLEAEIKKRKAPPKEAEVQVRPGGSGHNLDATFVECAANSIAILGDKKEIRIRRGDITKKDGDFRKLLDTVAGRKKGTIIFLIRPDGVGSYRTAYYFARSHYGPNGYCPNGKLPLTTHGRIDLSMFKRGS